MKGKLIVLFGIVLIAMAACAGEVEGGLFDVIFYDDAVVSSAEWYDFVTVYDSPPDRTTIEFYGRGDGLITHDSSTVNVHDGGAIGENWGFYESHLYGSSTVNVYQGGGFYGGSASRLYLYDSSTLNMNGGTVNSFLELDGSSTVNLHDGRSLIGFALKGKSTLNAFGGYINVFLGNSEIRPSASLNVYGYDFTYEAQGRWVYLVEPADGWWVSKLTGFTLDGEPSIYWGIPDPSTNPNINLIPEPGTFLLCVVGGLWLLRKRKTTRIVGREGGWDMMRIFAITWIFVVVAVVLHPGTVSYATTIAFYSDGVIQKGDTYEKVDVYDTAPGHTTVNMTGGWVDYPGMSTFDASVVNISAGFVGFLRTNDSSTVNVSGGWVGSPDTLGETTITAHGQSTINVYDGGLLAGWSTAYSELWDSSVLNVHGGDVVIFVGAFCSATVNVYAGSLFHLWVAGEATANIYGGDIGSSWGFDVGPSATVNIYGYELEYNPHAFWAQDSPIWGTRWVSELTGYGFDGTRISITDIPDPSTNPNINLIPEPGTLALLGLGIIGVLLRHSTKCHRAST